jgi:uncharacterized repeat protein (TIGR03803 family)
MWFSRAAGSTFLIAPVLLVSATSAVSASGYRTVYDFCHQEVSFECLDGAAPEAATVMDGAGNIYGTTYNGGDADSGTIFRLVKQHKRWTYQRLYSFCALDNCADGRGPTSKLVVDTNGNIYGTTQYRGPDDGGVVFAIMNGTYKVIYAGCLKKTCADGNAPVSVTYQGAAFGAPYDGVSPFYGINASGSAGDGGTLFRLTHRGETWHVKTLHRFCAKHSCPVGSHPTADLLIDGAGDIYGFTNSNVGHLYKFDHTGTMTLLHDFGDHQSDGGFPTGMVQDGAGVIYGVTRGGGAYGGGAFFKYDPVAGYSVVDSFCDFCDNPNGWEPHGAPVIMADGSLVGTTAFGPHWGNLYRVKGGKIALLYSFCDGGRCGNNPFSGVTVDSAGHLFGTTIEGGQFNQGTVYEYTP